jgi:NADH-quinone oxidoreductase subunit F
MNFEQLVKESTAKIDAERKGKTLVFVGSGSCGQKAGSKAVVEALKAALTKNKVNAVVTEVGCNGLCYAEPIIDIQKPGQPKVSYGKVTPEIATQLVEDCIVKGNMHPELALGTSGEGSVAGIGKLADLPMMKGQMRWVMKRCGSVDPMSIDDYLATGGYAGLSKALAMKSEDVIGEVKKSTLRGRGGAGFPVGTKWEMTHNAAGTQKYIICNADEGDPGSFVDRTMLESDPHSVLEGLLIGAYGIGASEAYIYIRAEYPLAAKLFQNAIEQAKAKGIIGKNVLGSSFSCNVNIRMGMGAYVCGEETALINSIEGEPGIPRIRPPYPANEGLFGKPTCVNNVESLANIPTVFEKGAAGFAAVGTERSKGTKLFSLTGSIARTGVVEVVLGMSMKQLIEDIGGGVPNGRKLKLIQPAGGMIGLLPANLIDTPLDYDALAKVGCGMTSGGYVVVDDSACIVDLCRSLEHFAFDEMCGKCVMGRLGTRQMNEILNLAATGKGTMADIDLLTDLFEVMPPATLCPLCGGATNPTKGMLTHFRAELEAHLKDHKCPSGVCPMDGKA